MKFLFYLFLFISTSLLASEPKNFVLGVNTAYGDYSIRETDLEISGPNPLQLIRTYSSQTSLPINSFGGWNLQPQTIFSIKSHDETNCLSVYVGTEKGRVLKFFGAISPEPSFLQDLGSDICNTDLGPINPWSDLYQAKLLFNPTHRTFYLILPDGKTQIYHQRQKDTQWLLTQELLPNKNVKIYSYNSDDQLTEITLKNSSLDTTLSWIQLEYEGSSVMARGSDGNFVEYTFSKGENPLLESVKPLTKPPVYYIYQLLNEKALLIQNRVEGGGATQLDYEEGKVSSLSYLYGKGEKASYTFSYQDHQTIIIPPCGEKEVHIFDENHRLISIETYLNDSLYRNVRFEWSSSPHPGRLLAKTFEDPNGIALYYKKYQYTPEGKPQTMTEWGNLSGSTGKECYEQRFTYQTIEEKGKKYDTISQLNAQGTGSISFYFPGTSIINRTEFHQNDVVRKRTFYSYDQNGTLIETITDNGWITDINDLDDTHQRYWERITPKETLPNFGAPLLVERGAYDFDQQCNITLSKTQFTYDDRGQLIQITPISRKNEESPPTIFHYDAYGHISSKIDSLGNQVHYRYDRRGNLIEETYKHKKILSLYDLLNLPVSITHTDQVSSSTSQYAYDPVGHLTYTCSPTGLETHYTYDSLGRLVLQKEGDQIQAWKYNLLDQPIQYKGPEGYLTQIDYTVRGTPTAIFHSDGSSESFSYSPDGTLYEHLRVDGILATYSYDYQGRITKIIYLDREKARETLQNAYYFYDTFHLCSKSDEEGKVLYQYNNLGELVRKTVAKKNSRVLWKREIDEIRNGAITDYRYNSLGLLETMIEWKDPSHYLMTRLEYSPTHQIISKELFSETGKHLFKETYQDTELISYVNNRQILSKKIETDFLDRPIKIIVGRSEWTLSYPNPHTTLISDPIGLITKESYDNLGNLKTRQKQDANHQTLAEENFSKTAYVMGTATHSYAYSPAGLLTQHNDTTYDYNTFHDLSQKKVANFEKPIEYFYTPQGFLKLLRYPINSHDFSYYSLTHDDKGRILQQRQKEGPSLERDYETTGELLSESIKDQWGNYTLTFQYDQTGCVTQIFLPDRSSIHYLYEGPYVQAIIRFSSDQKELYRHEITKRDLAGAIHEENLPFDLGRQTTLYDKFGHKREIHSNSFSSQIPTPSLDPLNNILKLKTIIGEEKEESSYTYTLLSEIASEEGPFALHYSYNNSRAPVTTTLDPSLYQFDALGRLTSYEIEEQITTYQYDFFNRRLNKDDTRFFYFNQYELGSLDAQGKIKTLRIPLDPNHLDQTTLIAIEIDSTPYIPLTDLIGNIRGLIDPTEKKVIESYHYSAFGKERIISGNRTRTASPHGNPWRFHGKHKDEESGLIYFGQRYYSPETQQWLTDDPLGPIDAPYLKQFCHNNPLKFHDPYGLKIAPTPHCGCTHHNHPGIQVRPSNCICICDFSQPPPLSGIIASAWNSPQTQGSLQAISGLMEAAAGGGLTLFSSGLATPFGFAIAAHGLDHFFTGLQTAFSGNTRNTVTNQILQKTGMPPETASLVDGGLSIAGSVGGLAAIRAKSLFSVINSVNHEMILGRGAENINSGIALRAKLSGLQKAQGSAVRRRHLPDGRIRYYSLKVPASKQGLTSGASYVTEWSPNSGQVRSWMESYNHSEKVIRVHPKMFNGQTLESIHYPPIGGELGVQ